MLRKFWNWFWHSGGHTSSPLLRSNEIAAVLWPDPFIRAPKPIAGHPGWYEHDGGKRPVKQGTRCAVPCGTYASLDGTGLMQFTAEDAEWEHAKVAHLRDDINNFCVIAHLPEEDQQRLARAARG